MKAKYISLILATLLLGACASDGSKKSGLGDALGSVGAAVGQTGATTKGGTDVGLAASAAGDLFNAATLTDEEVAASAKQALDYMDKANGATTAGKYGSRLRKLTTKWLKEDGLKLNFKVYMVREPNALAFPDGSIRVTSGLMDIASDDELRWVVGHEIGHVKLGHSAAKMKTSLMTSAVRKGVAAKSGAAGLLAASDLGAFSEALVNAQYSQGAEREADDYGLGIVKKYKGKPAAAVSILEKFAKMGESGGILSSHPASGDRAQRMREQLGSK